MRRSRNPIRTLISPFLAIAAMTGALPWAPIRPASAQGTVPSWSETGSLNSRRSGYTATLLADGKLATTRRTTGSTNMTRDGHTATRLPDGKVLRVRDTNAWLYEPATETWRVTGSLNHSRAYFTATLLGNGKVLAAGGYDHTCCSQAELTNTAELYDPMTGEWSLVGNLSIFRAYHTATLLANGKVLVSGGLARGALVGTNTAELYDPVTGKWSLTGNLSTDRAFHDAALLQNGMVLVAGGCPHEECMDTLGTTEVYDPGTNTWSPTGGLNTNRSGHTLTTLPDGTVLVIGGQGSLFPFILNAAEIYNPVTGFWSTSGSLLNRRWKATSTLLPSGRVLVAGGEFTHSEGFKSAELYDPATGTWNTTISLKTARSGHSATLLNDGRVLFFDSVTGTELYDPTSLERAGSVVTVPAASYYLAGLSSEAIASSFGSDLASATMAAPTLPLPTELTGTTVKVKDSAGSERLAPLLFVSPTQINYLIPAGTALGSATVTITSGGGSSSSGVIMIQPVAPSLFAANSDGQGIAAAVALRVKPDGWQSYEEIVQFDAGQNKFIARPLDLGPESDQVYLVLFGTGIRSRSSLSSVIATIGGAYSAVSFAGAQPDFAGLDQVNVLIPRSLKGRGEVDVLLTVDALMANPVRIRVE